VTASVPQPSSASQTPTKKEALDNKKHLYPMLYPKKKSIFATAP
jgi:hypothetical protein